jgi:hypothetical protein
MVGILTLQDEYCQPPRNPPLLFETARVVSLQPPVPCGGQPSRSFGGAPSGARRE